jgi:hypothetical protein
VSDRPSFPCTRVVLQSHPASAATANDLDPLTI